MRVLIGVDGTEGSLAAVRQVGRWFESDAGPFFFYYSPPSVHYTQGPAPDAVTRGRLLQAMVNAVFDRAKEQLPVAMRDRVECISGAQVARNGLLVAADETRAELLVVGSNSQNILERIVLGSVGSAIAHHATIPVLVVRSRVNPSNDESFRVLVACDRSDASCQAHDLLKRLPWPRGTKGEVISVFETMVGEIPSWLKETLARESGAPVAAESFEFFAADKQRAEEDLRKWCDDLPEPWRGCQPILLDGNASRVILDRLKDEAYDVVIVGARRQAAVARWILGSTSDAILRNAPCSVLIARQHEQA